ncbi:hypothetical protein HPB50_005073 [Hyalomma asiaticum]|uniref:Uncharacterized protein n=1 Tax=Hyalomma asiaticum TaxID=266040 RepID=A0ACB7SMR1_HYAAI|nr:hypothetical protein HPB50_005073 [Hyalomma asiaticum]
MSAERLAVTQRAGLSLGRPSRSVAAGSPKQTTHGNAAVDSGNLHAVCHVVVECGTASRPGRSPTEPRSLCVGTPSSWFRCSFGECCCCMPYTCVFGRCDDDSAAGNSERQHMANGGVH